MSRTVLPPLASTLLSKLKRVGVVERIAAFFSPASAIDPLSRPAFVFWLLYVKLLGTHPFMTKRNGVPLALPGTIDDFSMIREILVEGEYKTPYQPPHPMRIVDLGANIGIASLWFLGEFPSARIEAYEPDPDTFRYLKQNLSSFNTVSLFQEAALRDGEVKIYHQQKHIASSIFAAPGRVDAVTVKAKSLDTIVGDGLDILKVDIEGAEFELFRNATRLDRVNVIVGEVHLSAEPRDFPELRATLSKTHDVSFPAKKKGTFYAIRKTQ
jgi:FkbM family methyltransferase